METGGIYVLSLDPIVIAVSAGSVLEKVLSELKKAKLNSQVHILVFLSWNREPWLKVVSDAVQSWSAHFERVRIHWFTNTRKETDRFTRLGLQAKHCPVTIWIDEQLYPLVLSPMSTRPYDAIYIAAMREYKRLWLAQDIARLRIISRNRLPDQEEKLEEWCLKNASINIDWIHRTEMYKELAGAGVGLALSSNEGIMLANVEYLLSGLPVVSTKSSGGRDQYYTASNVKIVPADKKAVGTAVQEWQNEWTPDLAKLIRNEALAVQEAFRLVLQAYLERTFQNKEISNFFAGGYAHRQRYYVNANHLSRTFSASEGILLDANHPALRQKIVDERVGR